MINSQNYRKILTEIGTANLIAVSKFKPKEDIEALYALGHKNFGENRVQELLEKSRVLPNDIKWHFIGALQSNKVNKLVGVAHLIHSIDRYSIAEKVDDRAKKIDHVQDVLIQLNISEEESKSGFLINSFRNDFADLLKLKHINIKGLMTIGDHTKDIEKIRQTFRMLRTIRDDLEKKFKCQLPELSMGMSADYIIAAEEGATMIRIGSSIFGSRN